MPRSYLPAKATIQESCDWLAQETGEAWTLARLLEHGIMPWFWLDYQPHWPEAVFHGRTEGFLAPLCVGGDTARIAVDRRDVLVTGTRNPEGEHFLCSMPSPQFPTDELRFLRPDLERLAAKFSPSAADCEQADGPAPVTLPTAADREQDAEPATFQRPAAQQNAQGIPKKEVLSVDWPLRGQFNQASLSAAMSDVPGWMTPARVARGSPGGASALWNPAKLADCLVNKGYANRLAVGSFIGRHFREWLPDWSTIHDYL